jgi:hypothetical protein
MQTSNQYMDENIIWDLQQKQKMPWTLHSSYGIRWKEKEEYAHIKIEEKKMPSSVKEKKDEDC